MKITDADVIWTPGRSEDGSPGSVRVERHLSGWKCGPGDRWMPAAPAAFLGGVKKFSTKDIGQLLAVYILFNRVVCDGVPVAAAHEALLAIDEYRRSIPSDAPEVV